MRERMMTYGITRLVFGPEPFITISKGEYYAIKAAKQYLFEAYYLEQKIDVVMENHLEYEMALLSIAAQDMLFNSFKYSKMQSDVNDINRRIINLLSACRMYLDHYCHHLKNIYGESSDKVVAVRNQEKSEYDSNLSYRVLHALRNYVQHRGFPVQKVSFNSQREEAPGNDWRILFTVTPFIDVKELEEDKIFKRSVIEELKQIGKEIDIKPLIRDYVTCIGKIHSKIREEMQNDIKNWQGSIENCVSKFKKRAKTDDIIGLGIAMRDKEGLYPEMTQIFTDFIEHRQELEQKNSFGASLSRLYVSSKPEK